VVCPTVNTRIEETAELSCPPHDRTNITAFVAIAKRTRIGEITLLSWAAVLLANDVVYLTAEVGIIFVNQAIFAQTIGACYNQLS
jgi:hypothetical protein